MGWVPVGQIEDAHVEGVISIPDGYVARGGVGENMDMRLWFSPDGRDWTPADLAESATCGLTDPYADMAVGSEQGVVAIGWDQVFDVGACERRLSVWASPNGIDWQVRHPFEDDGGIFATPAALWSIAGGWEAVIAGRGGEHSLWRTDDGLSWSRIATLGMTGEVSPIRTAAADASGSRVISVLSDESGTSGTSLFNSDDGAVWARIQAPAVPGEVGTLVAPSDDRPVWTAIATDWTRDSIASSVATSRDLANWATSPFPMGGADSVISTAHGLLAYGRDGCQVTGSPCTDPERAPRYLTSTDGLTWASLHASEGPRIFADGPAGVVGFDLEGVAWRLEGYSDDEAALLDGFRDDARFACAPRRTDLPPRAVAGVVCSPDALDVPDVDEVGAYLFESQADVMATYEERLADAGVRLGSGGCPERPGEGAYVPEAPGTTGPYRFGCFVNEFGNANVRFTVPDSNVYVGILGTDGPIAVLSDWAWRDNLDQPGSPTVWR